MDLDKERRFLPRGLLRGQVDSTVEDRTSDAMQERTIRGPLTTAVQSALSCGLLLPELIRCVRDIWEDECVVAP